MLTIDNDILIIDKVICENIDLIESLSVPRALVAHNLLSYSRDLVEHIVIKLYGEGKDIVIERSTFHKAMEYIKRNNDYQFLRRFHLFLEESISHYTPSDDNAERLVLKYYPYYLMIKVFMKKQFNMNILHNMDKFPLDTDKSIQEYHEKIAKKLDEIQEIDDLTHAPRLYVHKVVPFCAMGKIYYEVTLTPAFDTTSKYDRFVCYSSEWIPPHYSVKVAWNLNEITLYEKKMPIAILSYYEVSIRPCELRNYARILGEDIDIKTNSSEYRGIMRYLTNSGVSLLDIVLSSTNEYKRIKKEIFSKVRARHFEKVLDKSRKLIKSSEAGSNVIRYLLHTMNNKVLKNQYSKSENSLLSGLKLQRGSIPFDTMPFATSLIQHIPDHSNLFGSIDTEGRKHELLSSYIHNNMNENSCLYTKCDDIMQQFPNVDSLIKAFNDKLYWGHWTREIKMFGENLYIEEAYSNTKDIIETLKLYSKTGVRGYDSAINLWLESHPDIDSKEKRKILKNLFTQTHVAMIYGSAGTGKTYLINIISQFFGDFSKILLANTNPAVENLRRNVSARKCKFSTIAKFITYNTSDFDILIVDECSMVSNENMAKILSNCRFKLIVLVGDTYQIESITFGNWFSLARQFIPNYACWELTNPYRTNDEGLLELWKRVRELKTNITEYIVSHHYSSNLDSSVFNKKTDDEIILCLNYDGLYGINNINKFLQNNNPNKAVHWDLWTFKKGDPILFTECERFMPVLYNNLKGTIVDVKEDKSQDSIWFSIEVDKQLMDIEAERVGLTLMNPITPGRSVVGFRVTRKDSDDDNDDADESDIPFQIAYSVSIHKAQGLEYESVKLIITKDIDELITHNIFYTAITRSKKYLKIYWSPETMTNVISNFRLLDVNNDATIFSSQSGIEKNNIRK